MKPMTVPALHQSRFGFLGLRRCVGLAVTAAAAFAAWSPASAVAAPEAGPLATSGLALVPEDAAFVSATLRLREQIDRVVKSNAWAALRELPGVKRALASYEEQTTMPGSPLAMVATFLELPENAQAVEVLEDMVATDTFVYGEPSCIAFTKLLQRLQRSQQMAGLIAAPGVDIDVEFGDDDEDESDEEDDDEDDDRASGARRLRARPVAFRVAGDALAVEEELSSEQLQKRLFIQTLADNLDLLVVPDLVWGFKTGKVEAAQSQLKRIEVLAKLVAQANPDLADAVSRRKVAGTEMVVFTFDGAQAPWDEIERELAGDAGDIEGFAQVFQRLRTLDVVVALGVVGDRVILSFGDSVDHLEKLVLPGSGRAGLLGVAALAPLRADADKRLTGVSYMSGDLAAALATETAPADSMRTLVEPLVEAADLPAEAAAEIEAWLASGAADYDRRQRKPGPWTAYSFLGDRGYEGYVWDWSKNLAVDGARRLDLLEHAGGAPLGVTVLRLKSDPRLVDDIAKFVAGGWGLLGKYGIPAEGGAEAERAAEIAERLAPLGTKLAQIVRGKIAPALADGQVGLVLDGKTKVKRLQRDLPASAEPLPVVEPAIVLPIVDPKLFRDGLSDLFALSDELVATLRDIDPDSVPAGYQVPDPDKAKVEGGSVWSFALPQSGLDEQLRPAIGVGDDVAVFSLAPKQAARLLAASPLETGSQLSTFEEPLASAAAIDVAGLVDVVEPWVTYLVRYGCVRQRDGDVDADAELTEADENEQAKDALRHVDVVLEVARCLRAAVAETAYRDDALVTHWRNVIRDLPKKP
jgi:hypothetical protein